MISPHGLNVEHGIKGDDSIEARHGDFHQFSYVLDRLLTEVAKFFLCHIKNRNNGSLFARIPADELADSG
jgi:hypothetical protein